MIDKILFALCSFLVCGIVSSQETYTVGKTEYLVGQYYVTTGEPRVSRSLANRQEFLESIGLKEVPKGYQVDHIIPLSEGGTDDPCNMQLLTIEQHKLKTAKERAKRDNSSLVLNGLSYYTNSSYNAFSWNNDNSNYTYSGIDFKGRALFTGRRGGVFYFTANGARRYLGQQE
jgi:hypothetical protein